MKIKFVFLLTVAVFLISLVDYAAADLLEDTESWFESGTIFLRGNSPETAIKYFDKILAVEPNNTRALTNKAIGLLNLGKHEEALSAVNSVLEIVPEHVGALVIKGDEFSRNGQFEEAYSIYETILKIDPNNSKANSAMGDRLLAQGKSDQALTHYKKALGNFPVGLDFEGVSFADKVLEIEPNNIDALNNKGKSLVHLARSGEGYTVIVADELDPAISYFDKVLVQEPENAEALFNKGRTIVQKADLVEDALEKETTFEEGLDYVRRVLQIDPVHVGALNYLGDRLVGMNKTQEGIQYLDKALEIAPDDIDSLFAKASALTKEKKYVEAVYYYDTIITENPFHLLAAANFKEIVNKKLGYIPIKGFLDVIVYDSNGALTSHMRAPTMKVLNHEISGKMFDEWKVIGTENKNGTEFQIIQFERTVDVNSRHMEGGAKLYGISYPFNRDIWHLYVNYWLYYVDKGDTVTFTYTVFRAV